MRLLLGIALALLVFIGLIWLGFGQRSVMVQMPNAPRPSVLVTTSQPDTWPASSPVVDPSPDYDPVKETKLPETPPYLSIVEPIPGRTPKLEASIASPTTLQLHTDGIRQLRLIKEHWPHEISGSIAVLIDGQGIEWTRKRAVLDLFCGKNGGWSVLPENPAVTPTTASAPVSP